MPALLTVSLVRVVELKINNRVDMFLLTHQLVINLRQGLVFAISLSRKKCENAPNKF